MIHIRGMGLLSLWFWRFLSLYLFQDWISVDGFTMFYYTLFVFLRSAHMSAHLWMNGAPQYHKNIFERYWWINYYHSQNAISVLSTKVAWLEQGHRNHVLPPNTHSFVGFGWQRLCKWWEISTVTVSHPELCNFDSSGNNYDTIIKRYSEAFHQEKTCCETTMPRLQHGPEMQHTAQRVGVVGA